MQKSTEITVINKGKLPLVMGCTYFCPQKTMRAKTNSTISLVNDCQGVNLIASPKQPQSVTL